MIKIKFQIDGYLVDPELYDIIFNVIMELGEVEDYNIISIDPSQGREDVVIFIDNLIAEDMLADAFKLEIIE